MEKYVLWFLMLVSSCLSAQEGFKAIDTAGYTACRSWLKEEYKKRFETFLKGQNFESTAQKAVVRAVYAELQEDFIDKITDNDFICNDEYLGYLRMLLDEILEKNGLDRSAYRILLSKDPSVNAYNTGDGTVVINYGLFLALENEDELVFVMSHEIGHQYLNHVRNGIVSFAKASTSEETIAKTKEIRKQKYGKGRMSTGLLKSIVYQNYEERRQHEIEADSIGMVFYQKTRRNLPSGISTLEKLAIADEERDSLTLADYHAIFDRSDFRLKERYFEEEKSLFTRYDKDKRFDPDSLRTHPACEVRLSLLKKQTPSQPLVRTISPRFDAFRKNSAYQSLYNQISSESYGLSLYEALKLYKRNPGDAVLKDIILTDLRKLKDARVTYTLNRYLPKVDRKDNSDSLNRFITFIQNIKLADLDVLIGQFQS
ncbi:MAG TPA: M48 family metallopeptidase [Flavobacterium sp.]|nr:M48 family metallopeptidase [Flavobacterium sp.]